MLLELHARPVTHTIFDGFVGITAAGAERGGGRRAGQSNLLSCVDRAMKVILAVHCPTVGTMAATHCKRIAFDLIFTITALARSL